MERNSVVRKTYTIKETGEVITRNVEGIYKVTDEDIKEVQRARIDKRKKREQNILDIMK